MKIDSIIASALLVFLILFGLMKVPHLIHEVVFYKKNNWNLDLDSGREVWMQEKFLTRFSFLPRGAVKMLVLINQVVMVAVIVFFWGWAGLHSVERQ